MLTEKDFTMLSADIIYKEKKCYYLVSYSSEQAGGKIERKKTQEQCKLLLKPTVPLLR